MKEVLMVIGAMTILCFAVILIIWVIALITDKIRDLHIRHIQKHRFDKPPTAKCYCRDCKRWSVRNGNGYCEKFNGWCTADNWFCWDADPTEKLRKLGDNE